MRLGYPGDLLDAIPAEALASFAGVGYHLDLAALAPGDRVLDLGSGSGTDASLPAAICREKAFRAPTARFPPPDQTQQNPGTAGQGALSSASSHSGGRAPRAGKLPS